MEQRYITSEKQCQIIDIIEVTGDILLCCSSLDLPFIESTGIMITSNNETFSLKDFEIDKTFGCFSTQKTHPLIKVTCEVPEQFLQRGNIIIFE